MHHILWFRSLDNKVNNIIFGWTIRLRGFIVAKNTVYLTNKHTKAPANVYLHVKKQAFQNLCGFTARRLCRSHAAGKSVRQPQNSQLKWGTKDAGTSGGDGTDSWITIAAEGMRAVSDVAADSAADPCHCEISTGDFLSSWEAVESSVTESGKDIPLPTSRQLHTGGKPNRIAPSDHRHLRPILSQTQQHLIICVLMV